MGEASKEKRLWSVRFTEVRPLGGVPQYDTRKTGIHSRFYLGLGP